MKPIFWTFPGADPERLSIIDRPRQLVEQNRQLLGFTIDVNSNPSRLPRSVISHDDVVPAIEFHRIDRFQTQTDIRPALGDV